MDYIRGVSRNQVILFPETVEDYITEDNAVRFIDAFAASLDLRELGFTGVNPADTGRPAYDPADLLRLYIYGYLNRVRSSRMLEREAKVNLEVMWLLGKLRPDFKTIADFRRDNLAAIKRVCREFTLWCRKLELFGGELVSIDGSKFKAVNNRRRNFSEARLTKAIKAIEEKISAYLGSLDHQDAAETEPTDPPAPSAAELREKIRLLTTAPLLMCLSPARPSPPDAHDRSDHWSLRAPRSTGALSPRQSARCSKRPLSCDASPSTVRPRLSKTLASAPLSCRPCFKP